MSICFSPYRKLVPSVEGENVYINNIKNVGGCYRIWRYIFNYDIEEPMKEVVPKRFKRKKNLSLYRYQNYQHFKMALHKQELVFLSPKRWNDPFESILYQESLNIGKETYYIACCCFTYDWIESEEAAWQRSGDLKETIRVEYDFDKICDELRKQTEYQFYFSIVDYSQSRESLKALKKCKPTTLGEYLNLMSLKRKAFVYENELRLFIVSKQPLHPDEDGLFHIGIDYRSTVLSVCLPPKKLNEATITKRSIKQLTTIDKTIPVLQSHLYEVD